MVEGSRDWQVEVLQVQVHVILFSNQQQSVSLCKSFNSFLPVTSRNRRGSQEHGMSQINFIETVLAFSKIEGSDAKGEEVREEKTAHQDWLPSTPKYWTKNNIKDEIWNESPAAKLPQGWVCRRLRGNPLFSLFKYFIQLSVLLCGVNLKMDLCLVQAEPSVEWVGAQR